MVVVKVGYGEEGKRGKDRTGFKLIRVVKHGAMVLAVYENKWSAFRRRFTIENWELC